MDGTGPVGRNEGGAAPVVRARALTKSFPLFSRRRDRMMAFLGLRRGLAHSAALAGVDLEAFAGEAVALIGENGSGKSTLLRMVAGVCDPDSGELTVTTPVSAILELGIGFHPEFTGRENAALYGKLVGIDDEVVGDHLDQVLKFAELGEYIDLPVRTYSSGMAARLAFAVATHVEPAVLVVDEALAVGDGAFQKKCIERMVRLKQEGRCVLFCSHAMYLVSLFCDRVVWLRDGRVEASGTPGEVIPRYERFLQRKDEERILEEAPPGALPARVVSMRILDEDGRPLSRVALGRTLRIVVDIEVEDQEQEYHVLVAVDESGRSCLAAFSTRQANLPPLRGHRFWRAEVTIPDAPFARGEVEVFAFVTDDRGMLPFSSLRLGPLPAGDGAWRPGPILPPHSWVCEPGSPGGSVAPASS